MSGPKISSYELEQQRRRAMEERARKERERRLELERRAREAEIQRQQKLIDAQMNKEKKKLEKENQAFQDMYASVNQIIEKEKERQRQQQEKREQEKTVYQGTNQPEFVTDVPDIANYEEILANVKSQMPVMEDDGVDMDEIIKSLIANPMENRTLIEVSVTQISPQPTDTQEDEKFKELITKMEEEYQEIVQDRAFFKKEREKIVRFEEVCKRQQEYHDYQMLRDAYYGEFQKIKTARNKWHQQYDKWKKPFEEAYIAYRVACQMMEVPPQFHYLKVETAEADIKYLQQETKRLESAYLEKQESVEIARVLGEVMEEMGYQVLGTKDIQKKTGGKVHNAIYDYGSGSGIHVMDNGERITMEIVGLEDTGRDPDDAEKEYLEEEQVHFCDSFREIEKEMAKRGVVLKNRIRMLPPSKDYAAIMTMEGYEQTEHKVQKKLSAVDKKAAKRKQENRKYMNE